MQRTWHTRIALTLLHRPACAVSRPFSGCLRGNSATDFGNLAGQHLECPARLRSGQCCGHEQACRIHNAVRAFLRQTSHLGRCGFAPAIIQSLLSARRPPASPPFPSPQHPLSFQQVHSPFTMAATMKTACQARLTSSVKQVKASPVANHCATKHSARPRTELGWPRLVEATHTTIPRALLTISHHWPAAIYSLTNPQGVLRIVHICFVLHFCLTMSALLACLAQALLPGQPVLPRCLPHAWQTLSGCGSSSAVTHVVEHLLTLATPESFESVVGVNVAMRCRIQRVFMCQLSPVLVWGVCPMLLHLLHSCHC